MERNIAQAVRKGGTLGALIVNACNRWGDRPALADPNQKLSYTELGEHIARAMTVLSSFGLQRGSALAIMAGNHVDVICDAPRRACDADFDADLRCRP